MQYETRMRRNVKKLWFNFKLKYLKGYFYAMYFPFSWLYNIKLKMIVIPIYFRKLSLLFDHIFLIYYTINNEWSKFWEISVNQTSVVISQKITHIFVLQGKLKTKSKFSNKRSRFKTFWLDIVRIIQSCQLAVKVITTANRTPWYLNVTEKERWWVERERERVRRQKFELFVFC